MDPGPATPSDEVLDLIGSLAMHRQAMEHDSGAGPAQSEALRKLNELLTRERDALQSHGPGGPHSANVALLVLEVGKLTTSATPLSGRTGYSRRNQWQVSQPRGSRNFSRKGRRTMGRAER
jgi:hypothetical protein